MPCHFPPTGFLFLEQVGHFTCISSHLGPRTPGVCFSCWLSAEFQKGKFGKTVEKLLLGG